MVMAEVTRPKYVNVVTRKSAGVLEPRRVVLDSTGIQASIVLALCQDPRNETNYNWLIDLDGTVYELAGWDKAVPGYPDAYVICIVTRPGELPGLEGGAMRWLLDQIAKKRGVTV